MFAVIVPQKCGISTVTNILTFDYINNPLSKNKCRSVLKKHGNLINVEQANDIKIINAMNKRPDYVFAVVRDPVQRVISAYNDRVLRKNKDLLPDSSWQYFVNHFQELVENKSDVGIHCRLQADYLGHSIDFFDRFFWTHEINSDFKPIVEKLIGKSIPDMIENSSKQQEPNLSDQQKEFFYQFYQQDYQLIAQAQQLGRLSS